MKKILVLALICMFTINLATFEATAKVRSGKRSFSRPPQQSTIHFDRTKATKKLPTKQQTADSSYKKKADSQGISKNKPGSSFWRNAGILAGGMMLGGLLANMFGFSGMGMLANILGMIFNVIFLMFILGWLFVAGRFLWRKIRGSNHSYYR